MIRQLHFNNFDRNKKSAQHRCVEPIFLFYDFLYLRQNRGRHREVDEQRQRVADRGDQRVSHNRGVKADLLCEERKARADDLSHNYRADQRERYDERDKYGVARFFGGVAVISQVEKEQLEEIGGAEGQTAEDRHAELLPQHLENTFELYLAEGQGADDGNRSLRARVTARARDHRDEGRQDDYLRQHALKRGDDHTGEGGGQHKYEQPRHALAVNSENARLHIGLI